MASYTWTLSSPAVPGALEAPMLFEGEAEAEAPDWGFDILTLPDLDASFTPRRDALVLADAFLRRLYTRRGTIWSDPTYGFYILDYLNDQITPQMLAEIVSGVEAQAELEERIQGINVSVRYNPRTNAMQLSIAFDSASGPFAFVLGITSLSTDIFLEV